MNPYLLVAPTAYLAVHVLRVTGRRAVEYDWDGNETPRSVRRLVALIVGCVFAPTALAGWMLAGHGTHPVILTAPVVRIAPTLFVSLLVRKARSRHTKARVVYTNRSDDNSFTVTVIGGPLSETIRSGLAQPRFVQVIEPSTCVDGVWDGDVSVRMCPGVGEPCSSGKTVVWTWSGSTDPDAINMVRAIMQARTDIVERRGKRHLTIETTLGQTDTLTSKLDVNPPPWLEPDRRGWVPMRVHDAYGGPLTQLLCVRIEENMAEKVARLNRTTTARDVYDPVWLQMRYRRGPGVPVDAAVVRRLSVLKIWVDAYGLEASGTRWKPGHEAVAFDPGSWLRGRPARDFDVEDIGQLAVPAPDLDELAQALCTCYAFSADLLADEARVAALDAGDRPLVLRMIGALPGSRLLPGTCWQRNRTTAASLLAPGMRRDRARAQRTQPQIQAAMRPVRMGDC